MTHSLDDALVERLRHRAVARLSLKRPTKTDRYDAELDNSAADRIAALEAAGVAELREEIERLRKALEAISSQAICYGMRADETELRDWLKFISETAESALNPRQKEEEGE